MTAERHLTWENFERDTVGAGVPADHRLEGSPSIALYYRPVPAEIGIEVDLPALRPVPASPFLEIDIVARAAPRGPVLAVSTDNTSMFRQVFAVLLEIADAIQLEHADPLAAAEVAVHRIANAIKLNPRLSIEQTIGLWGELWVLRRLLAARGPGAVTNWYGWQRDRHDFRVGTVELEVKSTLSSSSVHLINGAGQLAATDGHELFLVSIQLSRAPGGTTLLGHVRAVEGKLPRASSEAQLFDHALSDIGVSKVELENNLEAFVLRRSPELVPISPALPRLTMEILENAMSAEALARLSDIQYRVNVDGLGHGSTSELFNRSVPWMTQNE